MSDVKDKGTRISLANCCQSKTNQDETEEAN